MQLLFYLNFAVFAVLCIVLMDAQSMYWYSLPVMHQHGVIVDFCSFLETAFAS
jgi:hypothetical protein